jgi:hypothetical protein
LASALAFCSFFSRIALNSRFSKSDNGWYWHESN